MKIIQLIALAQLLFAVAGAAQHGIGTNWGTPIELPTKVGSNDVGGFLYSNMAALSNDKRVVILNNKPNDIYIVKSYDGVNWSIDQDFDPAAVVGLNSPKLIADQNDNIHTVWVSNIPKGLFYTQMDSSLNIVIDSVRIADNPRFGIYKGVYISVDKSNRLHVMWQEGDQREATDTVESFYARSIDLGQSWSSPMMISDDDQKHSCFPRGQFNAYSGDSLAIAWRDYVADSPEDWDVKMVRSTDGGANWSAPFNIASGLRYQSDPDLVVAPNGRWHIFYHDYPQSNPYWGMRIMYGYSDDLGQNWTPSNFVDTVCNNQRSQLVEGSRYDLVNDILWTFWKEEDLLGKAGGDMVGAYSTDNGLSWSVPEYITDNDSISIGFKSVDLLANGEVAVNYEVPEYPNPGDMRVFYNERQLNLNSVQTTHAQTGLNLFPNPSSGLVNVDCKHLSIQKISIYNLNGQMVKQQTEALHEIDMRALKNGLYLIAIHQKDGLQYAKIVLSR